MSVTRPEQGVAVNSWTKIVFANATEGVYAYASGALTANGGAERQQWLLARALAAAGWSVTVPVRESLEAGKRRPIDGVEFVGIGHGQYLLAWYRFLLSERPEWLYWRCAGHLLGPVVQIARLARVRTIFSAAFDTDVFPRHALTRRRRWWPLYAWGLSKADRLFVQHGEQLSQLSLWWRSKACVVPSIAIGGVSVKPHSTRQRCVAWVGMLRQPKRPDLLIEIAKRSPLIKYIVCGGATSHRSSPGYSQHIIEQLRGLPNIMFRGQVAPEEAERIIGEAALLLCTSDQEGFPNTFLQAWSHGTPVVTLKIDPDSVIKRLELGAVTGTVDATVEQLQRLLASPEERQKIAARACEYVAAHHSEEVVVKAFDQATHRVSG